MDLEARPVEHDGEMKMVVELGGKAFLVENDSAECEYCGGEDAVHIKSIPDDDEHILCPACGGTHE